MPLPTLTCPAATFDGYAMRIASLVLLLLVGLPIRAGAQGVTARLENSLTKVQDALGETFARALPLPSASAGVSYAFDPATGNFQRESSTFGQVYLDRADTLGARRVNLSFAYQYVQLEELDGKSADDLRDPTPIYLPGKAGAIEFSHLRVAASVHSFLFAGTYGITDDLEVSIAVPIEYSHLIADANLRVAGLRAADQSPFMQRVAADDTTQAVGVGDVFLRLKYRVVDTGPIHVAAGLLLRLPSGSQADLQGIGFFEVTPRLIASTRIFELAPWARLQGHLNAGVGLDTQDVGASEARWGMGLDWGITDDVTAAVAFLGRNQFARVAPPGFFDFPRCPVADLVTCATTQGARGGTAPLFGLSGDRPDYYDISIGGRGALWRDTVFAFVNVVVPLNDGFVRTAPIPLAGIEATF